MAKKNVIEQWAEVEDGAITNVPRGEKEPPRGQPLEWYLFGWDVERRQLKGGVKEFAKRRMITVAADDEDGISGRLAALLETHRLVPSGARDLFGARTDAYQTIDAPVPEKGER